MTNDGRDHKAGLVVYLGLGTNIGDREANLREALARIKALGFELLSESSIYETEPVGYKSQPLFLNQVIKIRPTPGPSPGNAQLIALLTESSAEAPERFAPFWTRELLRLLLNVEREMGRVRSVADGPRVIDIDILLCGDFKTEGFLAETRGKHMARAVPLADTNLRLPHPRMHLRRFVLEPLCEIAPEVKHPVLNKTCRELLAELGDSSIVKLYKKLGQD